jgi:hypothetical protein
MILADLETSAIVPECDISPENNEGTCRLDALNPAAGQGMQRSQGTGEGHAGDRSLCRIFL